MAVVQVQALSTWAIGPHLGVLPRKRSQVGILFPIVRIRVLTIPKYTLDTTCTLLYIYSMDIRLRDVDPKLHRDFKVLCTINGTSMHKQILELMRAFVSENAHKLPADQEGEK